MALFKRLEAAWSILKLKGLRGRATWNIHKGGGGGALELVVPGRVHVVSIVTLL